MRSVRLNKGPLGRPNRPTLWVYVFLRPAVLPQRTVLYVSY